jgi:type IV secretory pathway VirB4 component
LRWIMLQRLMQGRTVLSIDPEGENNKLCEAMGGKVIPAGAPTDPDTCLLHPLQAENSQDMLLAARFLIATLAGEEALTPGIQAVLHEAVKRRWVRNPGNMSIADLVDTLGTLNDPNAAAPMALLRPYMNGGLWEGYFDRPKALLGTELVTGQWLNFDLSTLREENRGIIHSVLAWFLYNVVTVGKTAMDIYIDEGWRVLRSGPFADLLDELGRRARKRDIGVTLITHMPQDLVKNPTSLSMASTAFIGRIGPEEAFAFFRSMGVTQTEALRIADQVSQLPPRTFIAAPSGGRGALFPVLVTIPPAWLEFWERLGAIQKKQLP